MRAVHESATVTLVVTQPDRASGRGHRVHPTPVKEAAQACGLETIEPERLRSALRVLMQQRADVFAVAAYGKMIPQAALDMPRVGALNLHPSLLPLYRGATPLRAAIRDGRTESGVTVIVMDAGMDTGDIALQERARIGEGETYGELHDRYAALGASLLARAVSAAASGTLVRTPQAQSGVAPEEVAATATRPLTSEDLRVEWSWPARRVVNAIRALSPEPLARAAFGSETVKLVRAHVAEPAERRDLAAIVCGDGEQVVIDRVIPPNRAAMSGAAYARSRSSAR